MTAPVAHASISPLRNAVSAAASLRISTGTISRQPTSASASPKISNCCSHDRPPDRRAYRANRQGPNRRRLRNDDPADGASGRRGDIDERDPVSLAGNRRRCARSAEVDGAGCDVVHRARTDLKTHELDGLNFRSGEVPFENRRPAEDAQGQIVGVETRRSFMMYSRARAQLDGVRA